MSLPTQDTSHDLPDLELHDETRYCAACHTDTVQRVGIHHDHYETDRYVMDRTEEYAHCCVCSNTATVIFKKEIIMKSEGV